MSDFLLAQAVFFENVSPVHAETCTSDTSLYFVAKKNQHVDFLTIFSAVVSPVQGWLHMQFSLHAGDLII